MNNIPETAAANLSELENRKLFHKDFTLVVIGQIISLFGNAVVRFALPLYLLSTTKSPALFGIVSAVSVIPQIILTPAGGIIADRVNKQKIMVALDCITSLLILTCLLLLNRVSLSVLLIVTLMILYGIQGTYQPAVQASLPVLMGKKNLIKANAVINQVSTLASILGPVLGGVLYGIYGIKMILGVSAVCFFLSAVMELFITIPFSPKQEEEGFLALAVKDFKEGIQYMINGKPVLTKISVTLALLNLFQTSLLLVAMPVVITQTFGMSEALYGYGQGAVAVGGLAGGIAVGVLSDKLKFQKSYLFLLFATILLIPIGLVIYFKPAAMLATVLMIPCCALMVASATMFTIQLLAFVQRVTPERLIGKVISCVLTLGMCAQPVGQALYGALIELFFGQIYLIFWGTAVIAIGITVYVKSTFKTENG